MSHPPAGVLVALAFVAWPAAAPALEPEDLAERWRWRILDREEGLPVGPVYSIGHDRDDFIYTGTDRGLLRYNGVTWTPIETTGPSLAGPFSRVIEAGGDVYAANASEVWLLRYGSELHRVLSAKHVLLAAGPLSGAYAIDAKDRTHVHLEEDVVTRVDEGVPLPAAEISDYTIDERRIHWLAASDGPYRRDVRTRLRWQIDPDLGPELKGRPCRRVFLVKRQAISRGPMAAPSLLGAPSFELWGVFGPAGAPSSGSEPPARLARRDENGWTIAPLDPTWAAIQDLVIDGTGAYAAVSEDGRVFVSAEGKNWRAAPALGIGAVALSGGFLDPHGYLWYRAGTSAIVRFDGLSRRWERFHRGLGLPLNNVLSLLSSSDGSIWAGTERGVYRYPAGPAASPAAEPQAFTTSELRSVTGLAEDRTGKIWIASEAFNGAYFFHEGVLQRYEPHLRTASPDKGVSAHPIRRIASDRSGDLWFLSTGRGPDPSNGNGGARGEGTGFILYRYSASPYTVAQFRSVAIPRGPANDLLQAQDRSYWIATEQGLLKTTPSFEVERIYTEGDGPDRLRSSRVWAIAESSEGSIWVCYDLGVASGVTRIRGDRVETFDERNGLVSPNAGSIACTFSPEGVDVWFGTDRGIMRFDGECWSHYSIASLDAQQSRVWPLSIARAPGAESALEEESVLAGVVGHGIYRLRREERRRPHIISLEATRTGEGVYTFRWDGRDFKNETPAAGLRFRTRIDDHPWSPFSADRTRSLAGLEAGDHVFHVEVRDQDGNSNRDPRFLPFRVSALPVFLAPAARAALAGAAGALGLAGAAALVLMRTARRRRPARAAREAAEALAGFPGAVLVVDRRGRVAHITGGAGDALGLSKDFALELVGRPAELLPTFQSEAGRRMLRRLLGGGSVALDGVPLAPGSPRTVAVRGFPGSGGSGAVVLIEDETVERDRAAHRDRWRRLSALQELASRIARLVPSGGADAGLIASLRCFSGDEGRPREAVDLAGVLDGASAVPPGVEVDRRDQSGLWMVSGVRDDLAIVLREIVRNAVEAMPEGGRLTLRLRNRRIEGDPGDLAAGSYVEIEVADSGVGIALAEMGRVFDPFYSTKPPDRSRGLGLSLAYGIVRRHRGDIRIISAPGAGTRVIVLLPADPRV